MSRSDVGGKSSAMDRRPTSPLLSEAGIGLRNAAETYLHFRTHSHSRNGSASDATPTPSASAIRRAQQLVASDSSSTTGGSSVSGTGSKLSSLLHTLQPSSKLGSTSHLIQPPPRSHSRSDSGLAGAGSSTASPLPAHAKLMASNAGGASSRGPYGSSGHLSPYGTNPTLVSASGTAGTPLSGSSTTNVATTQSSLLSGDKDSQWGALHVHVLPLFNRDPLRVPIEDLNALVRRHLISVISRNPARAVAQLEADVSELIIAGMVTLNSKMATGVDEEKLAGRIVDLWGFFWDQVLPYVEGVFLPLQTDPHILSLVRTRKPNRPPSPTSSSLGFDGASTITSSSTGLGGSVINPGSTIASLGGSPSIDVRKLALQAFRDSVVLPVAPRLQKRFAVPSKDNNLNSELAEHHRPRLEQMLLVLSSIATHNVSLASTNPALLAQLATPGEHAVTTLLRLVLYPPGTKPHQVGSTALGPGRLPSFLSGGAPRDRRGRLARKSMIGAPGGAGAPGSLMENDDELGLSSQTLNAGGSTLTAANAMYDDREREGLELLNSLRSPTVDTENGNSRPQSRSRDADGYDDEEDDAVVSAEGGTVMQHGTVPLESLGTGPGGWGSVGGDVLGPGDARVIESIRGNASRRAAIYDDVHRLRADSSGTDGYEEGESGTYLPAGIAAALAASTGSGLSTRRPSRVDMDGEREEKPPPPVERRPRI